MAESVTTYEGWYVTHDFRTIDWTKWKALTDGQREEILAEFLNFLRSNDTVREQKRGDQGLYAILGHKADLLLLTFRPTLEELHEVENQWDKTGLADYTRSTYSFLSIVELSAYQVRPGVDITTDPGVQARLKPTLPSQSYISFYPMDKKREGADNWYMLPMDERREMMKSHGMIGRSYSGKVRQIITGSIGLDDWEWGVTLFADDPLQFKKIVHEMRFDEASARFGVFGAFYTGYRIQEEKIRSLLQV
jgi:chlorite dismutase